jgi:hypothetical protein
LPALPIPDGWEWIRTGTIAVGKSADLIVVHGDPLQHINILRDPVIVIKHDIDTNNTRLAAPGQADTGLSPTCVNPNSETSQEARPGRHSPIARFTLCFSTYDPAPSSLLAVLFARSSIAFRTLANRGRSDMKAGEHRENALIPRRAGIGSADLVIANQKS